MRMRLMHDDTTVIEFDMDIWLTGFLIRKAELKSPSLLPLSIRIGLNTTQIELDALLYHWLSFRQIPDYRTDIDELLIDAYKIPWHRAGRMVKTQHTAALLSYYISGFDHYYITPVNTASICYVLEDNRFDSLYFLPPCDINLSKQIRSRGGKPENIPNFCQSSIYTIPSGHPSLWNVTEGKKILIQHAENQKEAYLNDYKKIAGKLIACDIQIKNGCLKTDLSFITGNTMWLIEMVPFLQAGCELEQQVCELLKEEKYKNAFQILMSYERQMNQKGYDVSWSEMCIMEDKERVYPVTII